MLHSRRNNKKIKPLYEKLLQLIQNDKLSSHEELLEKDGSESVHHRNFQSLALEILQIRHDQTLEIVTVFTQTTQE